MGDVHGESADAGEDDEGASLAKRDHACLCHLQTQCKLFQDRGNNSSKRAVPVAARRAMLEKKAPLSPGRNLCRCPVTYWGIVPGCLFAYEAQGLGQPNLGIPNDLQWTLLFDLCISNYV